MVAWLDCARRSQCEYRSAVVLKQQVPAHPRPAYLTLSRTGCEHGVAARLVTREHRSFTGIVRIATDCVVLKRPKRSSCRNAGPVRRTIRHASKPKSYERPGRTQYAPNCGAAAGRLFLMAAVNWRRNQSAFPRAVDRLNRA